MRRNKAFERIQCMAIFYYDYIMPCINERYGDTRTSQMLTVFCYLYEEVFSFFFFWPSTLEKFTIICWMSPFLEPVFKMFALPQEIQRTVQEFVQAYQVVLKLFEKSKKIKLYNLTKSFLTIKYINNLGWLFCDLENLMLIF